MNFLKSHPKQLNYILIFLIIVQIIFTAKGSYLLLNGEFHDMLWPAALFQIVFLCFLAISLALIFKRKKLGYYACSFLIAIPLVLDAQLFSRIITFNITRVLFELPLFLNKLLVIALCFILLRTQNEEYVTDIKTSHLSYTKITFITVAVTFLITLFFFFGDLFDGLIDLMNGTNTFFALENIKIFIFHWLIFSIPSTTLTTVSARLFYSVYRPKILFLLLPLSVVSYTIVLIVAGSVFGAFSGHMAVLGAVIYFGTGNLVYFTVTLIGTIFLFRKKIRKETPVLLPNL